jgi:hypothetical protein
MSDFIFEYSLQDSAISTDTAKSKKQKKTKNKKQQQQKPNKPAFC